MKLLRENIGNGKFHIHADGPGGDDRTLCGYAYEGACTRHDSDHGVVEVTSGKINCRTCLEIIRWCKAVPAKQMN